MKTILSLFLLTLTYSLSASAVTMDSLIEKQKIQEKIEKELLKLDVGFNVDIGSIDLIDGINLSSKYRYSVEPSYQDKYYTRIDKWDLNVGISPGTILKNYIELPFSFGVSRNSSFLFVRQFQSKVKSLDATPYTPAKLPLNAKKALKLLPGDFVSIPANLNLAVGAGASTSYVMAPVMVNAEISTFFVVSGEYTIQVFKLDETHVRLKIISNRSQNVGTNTSLKAEVDLMGFKIFGEEHKNPDSNSESGVGAQIDKQLDKQIGKQVVRFVDRIVDRDFLDFGTNYSPGASYIADYIFDLEDEEAQAAYNQILSSAYKLKDIIVFDNFFSGKNLKDKLITTTELADQLAEKYKNEKFEERKVIRIFKGFNNYKSFNRHIKLGMLFATYQHNTSYVENKLTFIDKNEHSLEFFYPTFSKYFENNLGKWFFNLRDQSNKLFFGLIPKKDDENVDYKNPDLGLTFERKDKVLTRYEHKVVGKFIINQLPQSFITNLKLDAWRDGSRKVDSRIFFQVVLKSQGFNYLRMYTKEELNYLLVEYLKNKKLIHILIDPTTMDTGLENDDREEISQSKDQNGQSKIKLPKININDYMEHGEILAITNVLYNALHDSANVSEDTLVKLLKLNEIPLFSNIGMGFLISLLPESSLEDFIYIKMDMIAKDVEPITAEFGKLNFKALYNEITTLQSRLSNRTYDLRISEDDLQMERMSNEEIETNN
jgi:hypothetical protein